LVSGGRPRPEGRRVRKRRNSLRAGGLTRFLEEGGNASRVAQNIARSRGQSDHQVSTIDGMQNRPQGGRGADSLLKMFRVSSLASMADQADSEREPPYEARRYSRWRVFAGLNCARKTGLRTLIFGSRLIDKNNYQQFQAVALPGGDRHIGA